MNTSLRGCARGQREREAERAATVTTHRDAPMSASCGHIPIQGVWVEGECPQAQETDAIQLATDHILDAADEVHKSGLAAAGYTLIAVAACAALAHPSHRTSIMGYVEARGMSIVFAYPAPSMLTLAEASTGTPPHLRGLGIDAETAGEGVPSLYSHHPQLEQTLAPEATCWRDALVHTSGAGGWNDASRHL
eukprot:6589010-Prymnesium_polylepis.1